MKYRRNIYHIIVLILGLVLIILSFMGMLDEFWNGMGSALMIVGAIRLLQDYRLNKNEYYREKFEIAVTDERNQFIRGKAWAWAGYLFIIIASCSVIVFKILGNDWFTSIAAGAVCLMLILYWGAYHILKMKY